MLTFRPTMIAKSAIATATDRKTVQRQREQQQMAKLTAAEVSPETKNLVDACEAQHRLRRREPRRRTEARAFPIPVVIGLDFGIAPAMTMLKLCPQRRAAARRQVAGPPGEIEIVRWATKKPAIAAVAGVCWHPTPNILQR